MKKKVEQIIKLLAITFPEVKCHLEFNSPFELIVSTVLAAQCTDERVNMTMVPLYKSIYRSPYDIIKLGEEKLRENIRSINFFNNKTKSVYALSKKLVEEYNGNVPETMEELTQLAGVGRKSASVILGNCYGKKDVIIVDTHFKRVVNRLGIIDESDAVKIEIGIDRIVPKKEQFDFSMRIGELGRNICKARKPLCAECVLNKVCDSAFKFD
ncbi:MAG: endonuclease III [Ignavibacteriaceae bacterium]|nr:MAG: endonuclease III [Chlorobiota bacterium]MBV6399136.1 Endonuclease III [Ignavibacteria bacterium]MCC6885417.1 endonuclease III [Ignavibacteriales bacterium]MCE7953660.1 endonuclease III [Chlorobi bacterium CHB7]MDL1887451.1 endonuclease III [Ignavibacteria bacterium CHB1]MEB2329924.1 endonuclease III [Ignavibacteriaceae bacterium]OQY78338.1 MAG: hypothetical protein B6D43_02425 [Ignavibacteriales bacterium UTCHB1]RIK49156.1 MAG: endonuclease III [Ignavibacteriota bacterium]